MKPVKITKAAVWGTDNGYYTKETGWNDSTPNDLFICAYGRAEYVVDCDKELKEKLKQLPNDSFMPVKISAVTEYLKKNGIKYEIVK